MMPKPKVFVQYSLCKPKQCSPEQGICAAAKACTRSILEQEEQCESPVLFFQDMCLGCGDCIRFCPLNAIVIK